MTVLKAGVIGLGVGERHVVGYGNHPSCVVKTLCDVAADKLAEVGARYPGTVVTENPDDVLSDPEIDIVSIASYDDAHYEQVVKALEAGKHVFVEKPLCLFDHELAGIRRALEKHPAAKLSSNLILRKAPRFAQLRKQIGAGEFGTPYYVEGDYNYGRFEKVTDGWRGRLPFYSAVHGGAIHMIDLIMWLVGERPTDVVAKGVNIASRGTQFRYNDTVVALLSFPSGMLAKVSVNFPCVFPHYHNLALYGTDATFLQSPQGAGLFTSRDPQVAPEPVSTPYPGANKGDFLPSFVDAVLSGGEPEVTAKDVLDCMAVSMAIERAVAEGCKTNVDYN